jgi:hypothetical protein
MGGSDFSSTRTTLNVQSFMGGIMAIGVALQRHPPGDLAEKARVGGSTLQTAIDCAGRMRRCS